jgi:hypothetical protein
MGMFDYISVADKLPTNAEIDAAGLDLYKEPFQTKDLDNVLATYYIQCGRLFVEKYRSSTWVADADAFAGGYLDREEPYQEELVDFHGKINFYHLIDKDDKDHWVEYNAFFTHGKLDKIELFKYRVESNVERNQSLKEIFAKSEERNRIWYNKYIFHTKVWRKVRRVMFRFLSLVESSISHIKYRLP